MLRTAFVKSMMFALRWSARQTAGVTATRREKNRAATITEIKEAALTRISSGGAGSLTLRGIARAIDMSPAGLYRYYEGLDAIITELITDAYTDLADAVASAMAGDESATARLREGMLAYRRWSIDHPNRFLLIFGTPIPGYAAPEGGPTVQANMRIGEAFMSVLIEGWRSGEFEMPERDRPAQPGEVEFASQAAPGLPPTSVGAFLGTWAHFHGMVTLEILNQLDWAYEDPGAFYRSEVDALIRQWTAD
jgi:AcrR family transcriptional regulator